MHLNGTSENVRTEWHAWTSIIYEFMLVIWEMICGMHMYDSMKTVAYIISEYWWIQNDCWKYIDIRLLVHA